MKYLSLLFLFLVTYTSLSQERLSIRTAYKVDSVYSFVKVGAKEALEKCYEDCKEKYQKCKNEGSGDCKEKLNKCRKNCEDIYLEKLHIQEVFERKNIVVHKKDEEVTTQKRVIINGSSRFIDDEKIKLKNDIVIEKRNDTIDCKKCPSNTKASVRLRGDKLYVNYFLEGKAEDQENKDIEALRKTKNIFRDSTYFFQLKNRQTLTLKHNGWVLSGLTIPLKYRFSTERRDQEISDDFSASINLNAMISYTLIGRSKFTYLKNLDNSIRDFNWTLGGFVGASTLTLNSRNTTSAGEDQIPAGEQLNQGLFSIGLGTSFSYNSFSVGLFYGHDFGLGQDTGRLWDFEGSPFIGVALGINVLNLGRPSAQ